MIVILWYEHLNFANYTAFPGERLGRLIVEVQTQREPFTVITRKSKMPVNKGLTWVFKELLKARVVI